MTAGLAGWLWSQLSSIAPGYGWLLLAASGLTAAAAVTRWVDYQRGSRGQLSRWTRRGNRNDGMASTWQLLHTASTLAVRRRARILRPSYAQLGWWRRWRAPATEFATRLARVGWLGVWSPVEDVTLRLGGPRTGKTGELACRILDAPGAVVATSTRTDLLDLTSSRRAGRGPVHVFNPSNLAGIASTIKFSPLLGCTNPRTAADRATDLVAATTNLGGTGDREFWAGQARDVLAVLMHAAALADGTMHTVAGWIADTDRAQPAVLRALDNSPQPDAFREVMLAFFATNDRTRTSITASIRPALSWLTDTDAAASATGGDEAMLDVAEFLHLQGTLYLLGAEDAIVAPLVTCLTAEIARTARRLAAQHGGRLDPPLTLALDEAALICPVPLDRWTADMGGRNITIHIAAQSRAQLRQRWGETGAAAILNNASTMLIFGGMRDHDDLRAFETLSGEREEQTVNRSPAGQITGTSTRRVPVLSAAQIANLPTGRVMIIRRGIPTTIGRVQMAWQRHHVRRTQHRSRKTNLAAEPNPTSRPDPAGPVPAPAVRSAGAAGGHERGREEVRS